MISPLYISQSLIKKFLKHGEERIICPKFIYETEMAKSTKVPPTLPMLHGSYFETLTLGGGRGGHKTLDLPRKKLTIKQERENRVREEKNEEPLQGTKTIAQIRIEEQAERFNILRAQRQVMITEYNTQVPILKKWGEGILLRGELDIFPTPILGREGLQLADIDMKLTWDIDNKYGDYCWGDPERMDHTQAQMYHYLVRDIDFSINKGLEQIVTPAVRSMIADNNILFLYWVFSYGYGDLRDKFVRYDWDKTKEAELEQSIRLTIACIEENEGLEWPAKPEYERCEKCPLLNCTEKCEIQSL